MSALEEIVPGVHGITLGFVNAFVLVDDDVTLIDTGTPKSIGRIEAALREIGREQVQNVALTHHHPDHRGGASTLARGARLFVHPIDASVVRGERKQPGPSVGGAQRLLISILRPVLGGIIMGNPKPASVDTEIEGGAEIPGTGGLRAVHTPGHTAGHLSFFHPGKRLLFVGDAAQNRSGLALPPPFFTEDAEQAKRTLATIAALDFDVAVFGHGTVLRGQANTQFRTLAEKYAA